MKRLKLLYIVIIIVLSACSNIEYNDNGEFTYSKLQSDFPIPITSKEESINHDYVKYELNGIGKNTNENGEIVPLSYLNKIEEDGWIEEKDEAKIGKSYIFSKENKRILLELHENYFELTLLK